MATAESLRFSVDKVIFTNEKGWAVLSAVPEGGAKSERVSVVGSLASVRPGESVEARGAWSVHKRFGRQFTVDRFSVTAPATERGLVRFLESLPGVGPASARALVEAYGETVLDVLRGDPEVPAAIVGPSRAATACAAVRDRGGEADAAATLRAWNVPQHLVAQLIRRWGSEAADKVKENPYQLIADYSGVGFKTADAIFLAAGGSVTSEHRIQAAVLHCLREASTRWGHTYLSRSTLMQEACRLLGLQADTVLPALVDLEAAERVVLDGEAIYLRLYFDAESSVDGDLRRISAADASGREVQAVEELDGVQLSPKQREAIDAAAHRKVLVVTGGPGTGKTTITRAIVDAYSRAGLSVVLCSPTGRAAKRLSEATGWRARTIHRTLEYHPELGWRRNRLCKLSADAVIVDEVSMVDVVLMARLLAAVPDGCRLIMVGDADQLPSVGPGRVLRDVIDSSAVPVVELHQIFRQAAESSIVRNAHRVNRGAPLDLSPEGEPTDFYLVRKDDADTLAEIVVRAAAERLPQKFGFDPLRDVWVLTPMHKGALGTENLNKRLQEVLNPNGQQVGNPKRGLRVGDKVMQHRNNYDLDVYNGDAGIVARHVEEEDELVVAMDDGREVTYDRKAARDLYLAYAITIHKSQGSEYPCAVVVCHSQHTIMLQRTLLYTGMTRAKRLLVLAGCDKAIRRAISTADSRRRNSGLGWRLAEGDVREKIGRPGVEGGDQVGGGDDVEVGLPW